MNSLVSGLEKLTLSDFPLTESHLGELKSYSSSKLLFTKMQTRFFQVKDNIQLSDLQSCTALLNREISEQYIGSLGARRIRKNDKDQPFSFTIRSIGNAIEVQIILNVVLDKDTGGKTKRAVNILVDFSSNPVAVTLEKAALFRFCSSRPPEEVDLEIQTIQKLSKDISCISTPIVKRYMGKGGKERAMLEYRHVETSLVTNPLNIKDSLLVLHKVAKMLQEIHNAGFVFRNVRPEKLLISDDPDPQVQLQDFFCIAEHGDEGLQCSPYPYWDLCAQKGIAFTNCDVFGLAVTTCQMLIPSFMKMFENPKMRSWLLTEYGQAKFLCFILLDSFSELYELLSDRRYDTAKLIDCLEKVYNREKENPRNSFDFEIIDRILKVIKIQAAAIAIMANEENASRDLLYLWENRWNSTENAKDFFENVRKKRSWLSTAESRAEQLYKLHLEAPRTTTLGLYLPRLAEGLKYPLSQMMNGNIENYAWRVFYEMKVQLLERRSERRIRKRDSNMPFTYMLSDVTTPTVTAQIIFPKAVTGARLGQGTYKQIKRSFSYSITFRPSQEAKYSVKNTALHRFKKTVCLDFAMRGIENHKKLIEKLPSYSFVVPVPTVRQYLNKNGRWRIEMETERFPSDLSRYTHASERMYFFFLLGKAAKTIQQIHDVGFVHRDVYERNILVNQNERRELQAYINDFDFLAPIGYLDRERSHRCSWWDACSDRGIVLPNCDVYGLAATAFNALMPDVNWGRKKIQTLLTENEKIALLRSEILKCYPWFSSHAKTLDELMEGFNKYSRNSSKEQIQAKYEAIRIMAREEKNSEDLLRFYTENPDMHADIQAFLVKAKEAIPTLSTAASLAEEFTRIGHLCW